VVARPKNNEGIMNINYKDTKDLEPNVLIAYDREIGFYQNCGFELVEEKTPMFITSLWT